MGATRADIDPKIEHTHAHRHRNIISSCNEQVLRAWCWGMGWLVTSSQGLTLEVTGWGPAGWRPGVVGSEGVGRETHTGHVRSLKAVTGGQKEAHHVGPRGAFPQAGHQEALIRLLGRWQSCCVDVLRGQGAPSCVPRLRGLQNTQGRTVKAWPGVSSATGERTDFHPCGLVCPGWWVRKRKGPGHASASETAG